MIDEPHLPPCVAHGFLLKALSTYRGIFGPPATVAEINFIILQLFANSTLSVNIFSSRRPLSLALAACRADGGFICGLFMTLTVSAIYSFKLTLVNESGRWKSRRLVVVVVVSWITI